MKKVVITGSSGFIGRHTLPFLIKRGYEIYPLHVDLGAPTLHTKKFKEIGADALLHFAWETTPGAYWHASSNLDWLKSSLDLIQSFALCGGKRVVVAGSCAETIPSTIYGACKESLRLSAAAFLRKQQMSFAWGRIFSPYGPYEYKQRLIPSLIQNLLSNAPFTCTSQNHVRDFIFVEDVAEAFVSLLDSSVEGTIEMGSGEGIQVKELVQLIASKMGSASIHFSSSPEAGDNPSSLIANPTRLFQEVGFTPKHSLYEGIDKTIQWWKKTCIKGM
ncbi:MAG TPA: NAD(P)-dependent oxidoreductase [Waddliaceae bacterium]